MKAFILLAGVLVSSAAFAQTESAGRISVKNEDVSGRKGFHWITHRCVHDESDEIETTPGSPPLSVDDPATPGCNKWEINVTADGDLTRDGRTWNLPLLDINYGVGDNLQLKYEVPNVVTSSEGSRTNEVGDSKAGVKYQFYGNDESKTQIGIYPQVLFSTPGSRTDSERTYNQGSVITLPVLIAKRIARTNNGDVMLTANLGYNISSIPETTDFISAAVGVGAPLFGKAAALYGELMTEQATGLVNDVREELLKADVGIMAPVAKHLAIYGSVGKSLVASDERDHTYFVSGFRIYAGE